MIQILEEYIQVHGRYTQHNVLVYKLNGVLLYDLALPLPEVMIVDPLVLFIPNDVELGLDEGSKHLSLSY